MCHEVNKHIFEAGIDLFGAAAARSHDAFNRVLHAASIGTAHVKHIAEGDGLLDAWLPAQVLLQFGKMIAMNRPGGQVLALDDLRSGKLEGAAVLVP